ncbi:MAG: hypothetical protein Q9160_000057 [Pyrenula sp. 1 TL-2023]
MARVDRFGFLAIAVVFHLIYIWSIFDIYFVSPIVSGMNAFDSQRKDSNSAPAKRLVLFVGDGLRADKAFQSFPDPTPEDPSKFDLDPKPLAPFLRSRVLHHGTFGVSHTRVPTESRPGHVALIAGLYEDVSAVTTGWKLNPVNFDSVFNRSRHTWSWGSPDILPMFKEGAIPGRIDADTYSAEAEDFTQDASELDVWVFDKVKAMLDSAKQNVTLDTRLREDKVVFFLHLIGLDTTGHAYRPYSKEYLNNIKVVDRGIEEITKLIESFYDDGRTAFVFTADHGMSDWGSHGDGHPDNTRTPLIAWGSGVARPRTWKAGKAPGHEDEFSHDWNLDHVQRHDVAQADVAALMAYLAGLEFPVNSVGKLPLSYLAASLEEKAHAALANAQGILDMYRVKEERKASSTIRYRSFEPFAQPNASVPLRVNAIKKLIAQSAYEDSIKASSDLLELGIEGLRYLQTYDWLLLRTIVTMGYLGWIAYATITIIDLHVLREISAAKRTWSSKLFFSSSGVLIYSALFVQKSSWTYYAYAIFPIFFWEEVTARRRALNAAKEIFFSNIGSYKDSVVRVIECVAFVGLLEALVQSYFRREIYTICFILATGWPFLYGAKFIKSNIAIVLAWVFGCIGMSTFTMMPALKIESANLITYGGVLMFATGVLYMIFEESITTRSGARRSENLKVDNVSRLVMGLQIGLIPLAIILTRGSIASLQAKKGLPLGNQIVGWMALVVSLVLPFVHRTRPNNHYLHRLVILFLTFSPAFIILTISYEGLFYFTFWVTVVTWVRLEHRVYAFTSNKPISARLSGELDVATPLVEATKNRLEALKSGDFRQLTLSDARIALFFLFLLQSAFFSTGNIASLASFSLDSVYRLIPVFDPFSQGALLVFKIMIPFAIISANLGVLNRRIGVAPSALFMIVMAISDIMTLNFFFMVKDEGSWLDIGTTISHFCIASLLSVFVAGLEFVSEAFISGIEMDEDEKRRRGNVAKESMNGSTGAEKKVNGHLEKDQRRSIAETSRDEAPG